MNQVSLVRPEWNEEKYHQERWQKEDVTILICQRKTRDLIRLCVSSILNFYPEINILVVDGESNDDSIEWLRFISAKHSNVNLWELRGKNEGGKFNSHGVTMHEAIMQHVKTRLVLLMDSDTIVRRHGFIEGMLGELKYNFDETPVSPLLPFAIGSLMLVTREGHACGDPKNENDVLRYAHPSCSLYDVWIYKELKAPFCDHGAPCVYTMLEAERRGYEIKYFPVDKYVQHLCGASWQTIPTIWNDDGDVHVRPLITFICNYGSQLNQLEKLNDHDFNFITPGNRMEKKCATYSKEYSINNYLFDVRFQVNGYYVCNLMNAVNLDQDLISIIRQTAIETNEKEFLVAGLQIYERKHWQKNYSML